MEPVIITQVALFVVAVDGWLVGKGIHVFLDRKSTDSDHLAKGLPRMGDTIAFISGAVGILLGLLLSFSVSSFQDAQASVKEYGSSVTSAYRASQSYAEPGRGVVRQDLVCAVQTFTANDWAAGFDAQAIGDSQANLWMAKLNNDVNALPLDTTTQQQAFPVLLQSTLDMSHWRQLVLLTSVESIPTVIWIVIYVSVFFLSLLLALHLADRKGLSRLSFIAAYVTLAVIVLALSVLDYPMHSFMGPPPVSDQPLVEILNSDELTMADNVTQDCPTISPADIGN